VQITTGETAGIGKPSEDRIVISEDGTLVAVLDGVSTLGEDTPRGGWYAETLGQEILAAHQRDRHLDLRDTLHAALTVMAADHQLVPKKSPAATVAIVRHREADHMIEALVLCDTPVMIEGRHGIEVLTDDRLETLVESFPETEVMREQLRAGIGFASPDHRDVVQRMRDLQMQHINETGDLRAYWVAEADPHAAHQAVVRSWPEGDIFRILVRTDGVDPYGLWNTDKDLANACATIGPQTVVETILAYEQGTDPHGITHPR
jgi:hypothetical protein